MNLIHVADAVGQSASVSESKASAASGNPTAAEPSLSVEDDGVDLQNRVDELEEQVGALEDDNVDLQIQIDALVDDLTQYECVLAGWGFKLIDDGDPVMVDRDLAVAAIALFTQALGSSNNIDAAVAAAASPDAQITFGAQYKRLKQMSDAVLTELADFERQVLAFEAKHNNNIHLSNVAAE
jgi:hypothetical protein